MEYQLDPLLPFHWDSSVPLFLGCIGPVSMTLQVSMYLVGGGQNAVFSTQRREQKAIMGKQVHLCPCAHKLEAIFLQA